MNLRKNEAEAVKPSLWIGSAEEYSQESASGSDSEGWGWCSWRRRPLKCMCELRCGYSELTCYVILLSTFLRYL